MIISLISLSQCLSVKHKNVQYLHTCVASFGCEADRYTILHVPVVIIMSKRVKKPTTKINVILIMGFSMIQCVPGFKSGIQDSFEHTNQSLASHMHVYVQCLYVFFFSIQS